jgi:hypothetical protein
MRLLQLLKQPILAPLVTDGDVCIAKTLSETQRCLLRDLLYSGQAVMFFLRNFNSRCDQRPVDNDSLILSGYIQGTTQFFESSGLCLRIESWRTNSPTKDNPPTGEKPRGPAQKSVLFPFLKVELALSFTRSRMVLIPRRHPRNAPNIISSQIRSPRLR